jgi:AcrR family transcriptional regulator
MGREIKAAIIRACRELVPARGLHSLTVDELAARAGVSKRTLYRYFRSKDEVIETTIFEFVNEMAGSIREVFTNGADPASILNSLLKNGMIAAQSFRTPTVLNDMRVKRHDRGPELSHPHGFERHEGVLPPPLEKDRKVSGGKGQGIYRDPHRKKRSELPW